MRLRTSSRPPREGCEAASGARRATADRALASISSVSTSRTGVTTTAPDRDNLARTDPPSADSARAADRLYERLLVVRCQAGDAAAFEELVGRYGPRLRFYLRKVVGDAHRAEDLLQEVWFDAFRAIARLRDPAALATWLYRLARDRAFRELRRRRLPLKSIEAVEAELPPAPAGSDDGTFTADDAARVHAALDRLAPEHREALWRNK